MVKFAAAGYVCVDYYPDFDNRSYATGNGVDVLFNLLQMRDDLQPSVVSAISDDAYGKMCLEAFKERNIDCSHLEIIPGGDTASVELRLRGNDRVHNNLKYGVMKGYKFSDETIRFLGQHDIMHTDFTGLLLDRLGEIRSMGCKVFFDFSNKINHPQMEEVLPNVDYGLISFEDDIESGKAFIKHACEMGVKVMIATFGEKGSLAYDGKEFYEGKIVPVVHVVNTVGAGDSYFSGFISGVIDELPISECMKRGAARSAHVISGFNPY